MGRALTKICQNLDSSVRKSGLHTRPGASNGAWLAFLLPSIIIFTVYRESNISPSLRFAAVISSGLFGASAVFISYLATTEKNVRKFSPLFYLPAAITSSMLFFFLEEGISVSLLFGLGATFSYFIGLPVLLERFPHSFTFGEASIVAQAIVIFVLTSITNLVGFVDAKSLSDLEKATIILQVGLLGCGIIILGASHFSFLKGAPGFYVAVLAVSFGLVVPVLHYLLQESPILWIIQLLFSKPKTVILFLYWLICSGIAALVVNHQLNINESASTVVRKNFHYLIVAVFIPGIITDITVLYLSSGVILALFMILETIRVLKVPPFSDHLQSSAAIFIDEKDQGILVLTPMYLLVGCSLPFWIHPQCFQGRSQGFLLALAGILSVGIGDTAASVGGVRFGKHKWPGSIKSIEGTVIAIFCQTLCIGIFVLFGETAVTAAVYGPIEVKPNKLVIDRACVETIYRPKTGQARVADKTRENLIGNTCSSAILAALYPRTSVSIIIQEMHSAGGLMACAINAACLALIRSGIAMKFLIAAVSCAITKEDEILLDPDLKNCKDVKSELMFAFDNIDHRIVAVHSTGQFSDDQYKQALHLCAEASEKIFDFYRDIVKKYAVCI
ncbi:dolichol kinase-like [Ischnura elegans]|uniref:dolichol kinase-like n=1 Tax=Ischnura elegans TaxID=197161 RepID=UPI001ED88E2C|nr:dolichol kinase-like [Ischnura elegans]